MPYLKEILQSKQDISILAKAFGLSNPRLVCDEDDDELQIIVSSNLEEDEPLYGALKAALISYYHCQVSIIDEDSIKEIYESSIFEKCASLDDTQKIEHLFGKTIDKIEIREPDNDKDSAAFLRRAKPFADEILKEKNINLSSQTGTSNPNLKRKRESVSPEREEFINMLLNPDNKEILEECLYEISNDTFSSLTSAYENKVKHTSHSAIALKSL